MNQSSTAQYSTFYLGDRLYGFDVTEVQEVTKAMKLTPVPLSREYVHGLINLRGQIATAISLRNLFQLKQTDDDVIEAMNVVCNTESGLMSFLVDRIGDVMEVENTAFEDAPDTIPHQVRRFMSGVYKLDRQLLSIIDLEKLIDFLEQDNNSK